MNHFYGTDFKTNKAINTDVDSKNKTQSLSAKRNAVIRNFHDRCILTLTIKIILKIINKTTLKTLPNYDSFKEKIIAGFKSGKGLTGKDGIFSVNGEGCFRSPSQI